MYRRRGIGVGAGEGEGEDEIGGLSKLLEKWQLEKNVTNPFCLVDGPV